jgi:hypothetical protein
MSFATDSRLTQKVIMLLTSILLSRLTFHQAKAIRILIVDTSDILKDSIP